MQVGSRVAFVARFLGRELAYPYEIVEFEPGSRLMMRTAQGPFPMETTYSWESVDAGTRMTLRNQGSPSGFRRLAGLIMVPAMRRANRKDLAKLRGILETRCSEVHPAGATSSALRRRASIDGEARTSMSSSASACARKAASCDSTCAGVPTAR